MKLLNIEGAKSTKYNYGDALGLSILFFDAQRSGKMPASNPIPWRHDSAMNDHGDGGVDLTGGWYDGTQRCIRYWEGGVMVRKVSVIERLV